MMTGEMESENKYERQGKKKKTEKSNKKCIIIVVVIVIVVIVLGGGGAAAYFLTKDGKLIFLVWKQSNYPCNTIF